MPIALSQSARRLLRETGRCELCLGSASDLLEVAERLGTPVSMTARGPIVDTLTPMPKTQARRNSLSSAHGVGAFPLHTDAAHHRCPPRWILLRCVDPGPGNRPTMLGDASQIELSGRQLREVGRAVWIVKTGVRSFLASALLPPTARARTQDSLALRYDLGCMRPADPAFNEAASTLARGISQLIQDTVEWEASLTLVIDNWRVLHGRGPEITADRGLRRLERIAVRGATS
jgi:L-asparagine oxygenase